MATPTLALASAAAFAIGELTDWALYTFTQKPFSQRILLSSLVAAPIDSFTFLYLIGQASPVSVLTMSLGKLCGACIVAYLVARREKAQLAQARI